MFGGNFAPRSWAFCNGQMQSIAQNQALFALIGTTYGGDGSSTFGLPNMISRLPVHFGQGAGLSNYTLGQNGGVTDVTLTQTMMPSHSHSLNAAKVDATQNTIQTNSLPAQPTAGTTPELYASGAGLTMEALAAATVQINGSSLPHTNMMPSLCISFLIALEGLFPARN